ncbi:hypothetical protein J6W34_05010 [bacterium]|nr:hypothetical protein [bacterium]
MGVILVRESENMCDSCIQYPNNECILGKSTEIIEKTAVGNITKCDEYCTKEMISNDRLH